MTPTTRAYKMPKVATQKRKVTRTALLNSILGAKAKKAQKKDASQRERVGDKPKERREKKMSKTNETAKITFESNSTYMKKNMTFETTTKKFEKVTVSEPARQAN